MDRKQVLYAENIPEFLDARSEFLEMEGYRVFKAHSPAEARHILEHENIHLAILDIRLENDDDEGDISGIQLARDRRYRRIPKIIVTGFPTFEMVRDMLYGSEIDGDPSAYAFLAKHEGPKKLVQAVNSAFERVVGINWKLGFTWDEAGLLSFPYLALLLDPALDPALLLARAGELEDLFRKLFPSDEQAAILRLNWMRPGCACLSLFALKENASRQAVVIFGSMPAVNVQRERFEQAPTSGAGYPAQPISAETMHYAAFAHLLADDGTGPFHVGTSFFQEAGEKQVRLALENLFKQALRPWHIREAALEPANLPAALPEDYEAACRRLQTLAARARLLGVVKEFSLDGQALDLVFPNGSAYRGPDPLAAWFDPGAFAPLPALVGYTLGGVRLASLLVGLEGRVYLTDLSGVTRAPILEDYLSVECELHFDRLGAYNLLNLLDLEKQLAAATNLNDTPPAGNVEPECRKALAAIQAVRKLAAEAAGEDLAPYLTGLFHHLLRPLLHGDPGALARHQVSQHIHRLLAASLALSHLERLRGDGSPASAGPVTGDGLQINTASRQVLLDGREVRLTQTEFKLLAYLHQNPNRLCSREEILSVVFDVKGAPAKSDMGLLNTHMDRLRKKIDSGKRKYIVTIRGEGYRLDLLP